MPLNDYALVVGIDRYPKLGPLSGAERDARAFLAWVTTAGGVNLNFAKLIVSSQFQPAVEYWQEQPARVELEQFFHALLLASQANNAAGQGVRVGARLTMFFSGHGFAPALDQSGVCMANATHGGMLAWPAQKWADRMHENGWFDEVLLFQDACRERMRQSELDPPFVTLNRKQPVAARKRFYAFSAKNDQKSLEKPDANNIVRGVFTLALLAGLEGGARDPASGEITDEGLKAYLQENMGAYLTQAERDDPDIASEPNIYAPDRFVIVAPPPGWQATTPTFPVSIGLSSVPSQLRILGGNLMDAVPPTVATATPWSVRLPRGFYKVLAGTNTSGPFEVSGSGETTHVHA